MVNHGYFEHKRDSSVIRFQNGETMRYVLLLEETMYVQLVY